MTNYKLDPKECRRLAAEVAAEAVRISSENHEFPAWMSRGMTELHDRLVATANQLNAAAVLGEVMPALADQLAERDTLRAQLTAQADARGSIEELRNAICTAIYALTMAPAFARASRAITGAKP